MMAQHNDSIEPMFVPFDYVVNSFSQENNFFRFLRTECHVSEDDLIRLQCRYLIGSAKDGSIIYWQLDFNGNARSGKIMQYDATTGHRVKTAHAVSWVHSKLIQTGKLTGDFVLSQCLFGEHILHSDPIDNVVAIVESEKSALLGSLVYPRYTWLATGGKCNLTPHKTSALVNRTVILLPDVDAYDEWKERARHLFLPKRVIVSNLLQRIATDDEREKKIDIGDWLIDFLKTRASEKGVDTDKARPP